MNSSSRSFSRFLALLADGATVFLSVWLAYFLRFNFSIPAVEMSEIPVVLGIIIPVRLLLFLGLKYFRGILRDTELSETFRIILVLIAGSFIFILVDFITYYFVNERIFLPFTIIILEFFLSTVLILFFSSLISGGRDLGQNKHTEREMARTLSLKKNLLQDIERKLPRQLQMTLRTLIPGKRILITGAGGSTANGLAIAIMKFEPSLLILTGTNDEVLSTVAASAEVAGTSRVIPELAETGSRGRMEKLFKKYPPQIVFHTAVYRNEKMVEKFPSEALRYHS